MAPAPGFSGLLRYFCEGSYSTNGWPTSSSVLRPLSTIIQPVPDTLSAVSDVLPLSYAVDAMQHLTRTTATGEVWQDLAVVTAFALACLALGAATLPRRTP